jgi:hypothetical protein
MAGNEKIHIHIYTALFELIYEVIELIELSFAKDAGLLHLRVFVGRADVLEYALWFKIEVHVMQAHGVEAKVGYALGKHLGLLFIRKTCVET